MNILHLSSTDNIGGRFTGYSMQEALSPKHKVEMAVWNRTTSNPWIHSLKPNRLFRILINLIRKLDHNLGFEGLMGISGWILPEQDFFKRSDILHLHLIHNDAFFSVLSLPMLSRLKPIVWTIHDPWAMTGGCVYSFDCERWQNGCAAPCPHPRHSSVFQQKIPAFHWKIKKYIYQKSNINLIVASNWMKKRVEKSPLLAGLPCHLIPFGVDLDIFKPYSKVESRRKLGIDPNHKIIAFRDVGLEGDQFKGMKWLKESLELLEPKTPTCLIALQDGRSFQSLRSKYTVLTPGWIDGEQLALTLSAADIFVMPSIQEAFGLMAVEAMATGTPVIVFEGTALPDVIGINQGGIVVPAKDSSALAAAIKLLLENNDLCNKLGKQARYLAEQQYGLPLYIERHIRLYEQVMKDYNRRI